MTIHLFFCSQSLFHISCSSIIGYCFREVGRELVLNVFQLCQSSQQMVKLTPTHGKALEISSRKWELLKSGDIIQNTNGITIRKQETLSYSLIGLIFKEKNETIPWYFHSKIIMIILKKNISTCQANQHGKDTAVQD